MVNKSKIPVLILAGGKGTRLSELTKSIPKPMVKVQNKPIINHIISHYCNYGFSNFFVLTGYKSNLLVDYFNHKFKHPNKPFVKCINTGSKTMTGGRLKRLEKILSLCKYFMFTYGDGLSNINIDKLLTSHIKSKKIITLSSVRPPTRFGYLKFKGNEIIDFKEKKQTDSGWINGGFFVTDKRIFDYISNDKTVLERDTLEKLAILRQLNAFKHKGFWQCVDTLRDKEYLDNLSKKILDLK